MRHHLERYPDVTSVDVLLVDLNGVLRGKRMPFAALDKLQSGDLVFPRGATLLDTVGRAGESLEWGVKDGDPDRPVKAVPGSLMPVAGRAETDAQVMVYPVELDGTPWFACPRTVLQRQLDALRERGLIATVAIELEFHVFDAACKSGLVPAQGRSDEMPFVGPQTYNLLQLDDHQHLVDAFQTACVTEQIPATSVLSEYGSGQFEINLKHLPDAMKACDHAVMLRRLVKNVAASHDRLATFMAKPVADDSGNGLHVHISLHDLEGTALFDGSTKAPGTPLRHAIAGLLDTLPASMALLAPNANSWRRFSADFYAPTTANWGVNHRQVALRIPMSSEANLRVEHRVAGADANPYLVVAAILAGVITGLENGNEPPPGVAESERVTPGTALPLRWRESLSALQRADDFRTRLGGDFVDAYVQMKSEEEEQYHSIVPESDLLHYLRTL